MDKLSISWVSMCIYRPSPVSQVCWLRCLLTAVPLVPTAVLALRVLST